MIVFAQNWTKQDNRKKEMSNKIRTSTDHPTVASTKKQFGREVDRLQPSLSSTKPYTMGQIKDKGLIDECFRIIEMMKKIS